MALRGAPGDVVLGAQVTTRQGVGFLTSLEGQLRPSEVGHPFINLRLTGGFTDADHLDHIHVGFD